jgi:DNA-binding transcriptional LysR family regulator
VFVQVVERGSFTAAADTLEVSKAAVSRYASQLEERLGTRLLNRTTRRLTLTEAGAALYARASGALAELAAAEAQVMELTGSPRGRLRVTAPAYFGHALLMPSVSGFLRRYPDIELEPDFDNRIVDLVAERFDVGIRLTALTSGSFVVRRLAEVRLLPEFEPSAGWLCAVFPTRANLAPKVRVFVDYLAQHLQTA